MAVTEISEDAFPDIPDTYVPGANSCLEDRRPRKFSDVVGQQHVVRRLQQLTRTTKLKGQRVAFIGPTGSGKTTLAEVTARNRYCPDSQKIGDACGLCKYCQKLEATYDNHIGWVGAEMNDTWEWWSENGSAFLERENNFLFIDEIQDLSQSHQKHLFRDLERSRATVVIATTHEDRVIDALWGRFGINKFYLRRPTIEETINLMNTKARDLKVKVTEEQLRRVAHQYQLNLRICVDFVYSAKDQTVDGLVTEEFLESVIGPSEKVENVTISRRARL